MAQGVTPTTEYDTWRAAIANRFTLQAAARVLLPAERVAECLRKPIPGKTDVEVWQEALGNRTHYRSLVVCGRVWQCAVCAAKITEKRRCEVSQVLSKLRLRPLLATFTLQHSSCDSLADTLSVLVRSWARLTSGKAWGEIRSWHCLYGFVRSLEVTWGTNGWHPHLHCLLVVDQCVDHDALASDLGGAWAKIAWALGGFASRERGFDLRSSNDAVADYIAKWGHPPQDAKECQRRYWSMEQELTKSPVKRARLGGLSPAELLFAYVEGSQAAGAHWLEYAKVFKGRRALEWSRSPDLRRLAGIAETTDQQAAEEHTEEARLLARLTLQQWRVIVANDARSEVLVAASQGEQALYELLRLLGAVTY